jgi:hypothetical protein
MMLIFVGLCIVVVGLFKSFSFAPDADSRERESERERRGV